MSSYPDLDINNILPILSPTVEFIETNASKTINNIDSNDSLPTIKPSKPRQRKYQEAYLDLGFFYIEEKNGPIPLCVLCNKLFKNSSFSKSKLSKHFVSIHSNHAGESKEFFKMARDKCMAVRSNPTYEVYGEESIVSNESLKEIPTKKKLLALRFCPVKEVPDETLLSISAMIKENVAKAGLPPALGEAFVKKCIMTAVNRLLPPNQAQLFEKIPVTEDIISNKMSQVMECKKAQLVAAYYFRLQRVPYLDKLTENIVQESSK